MRCMSATATELDWDTADRLRKALRVAEVGVGEMADYLGVNRNTISRYINGHVAPDRRTLRLWAIRCGVPLAWLDGGQLLPRVDSNHQPAGSLHDLALPLAGLRHDPVTVSGNVQLSDRDKLAYQRRFRDLMAQRRVGRSAGARSVVRTVGAPQ